MSSGAIPKSTPFDAAIAEVRLKIDELTTTLGTLLRLQAEQGGSISPVTSRGGEAEISHDTFFNMTIGEAAKKFLAMVKTTKSTAEIAEGLERGGLKHSSKSFATTVRSIIGAREDFTRVPNGDWGLTEWYPGMGRGRKPTKEKPKRRKAAGRKRKNIKVDVSTAPKQHGEPTSPAINSTASTKGPQSRIEEYCSTHPTATPREIADELGMRIQTVSLILSKLKSGKAA